MDSTISTVQNFLKTVSFPSGGKILAAVSGGADSVAMLHILHHILNGDSHLFSENPSTCSTAAPGCDSFSNFKSQILPGGSVGIPLPQSKIENRKSSIQILCAHINHRLRDKESDDDERFTAELCDKLDVPFFTECIDVKPYAAQKKLSIETAARQLRLAALVRIARRTGCQYIATAHHKDDQAETILFRLLRGTAFAGLAGIRPVIERSGLRWIRPMLHVRRTQIESYCRQNNLSWRQDASNLQTHFRRNWIRHRLLPLMQQNSENDLTEKLAALAQSALALQQHVESAAGNILNRDSHLFSNALTAAASASEPISQSSINQVDGSLSFRRKPESSDGRVGSWPTESSQISNLKSQIFSLSASAVHHAGPFVAGEILRTVLTSLGCGLRDISLSHYQQFFRLLDNPRAVLELPGGCTIRKKDDTLIFETVNSPKEPCFAPDALKLSINNNQLSITQFGPWRIQTRLIQITQNDLAAFQKLWKTECSTAECSTAALGCDSLSPTAAASASEPISRSKIENRKSSIPLRQWFDLAKIQAPIVVRCRQKDDSFTPFGRKTSKKINRFLTDSQIDPKQKESCFVIEDKTGILWLAPVRRSACAAVAADTIDVLEISITPKGRV
jgi:tRNA(Ile)-lysidine synthetase-like protein